MKKLNISKPFGYQSMVVRETHLDMGSWGCTLFTSSHRPGTEARGWHGRLQCPSLYIALLHSAASLYARSLRGHGERASPRLRAHAVVGFARVHPRFQMFQTRSNLQTSCFKRSNFQSLKSVRAQSLNRVSILKDSELEKCENLNTFKL